jgi:hypothetical protein
MLMPCSDVVYCPKDQEDIMRELLKTYGGHRHKTVPGCVGKRQETFVYIAPDD